MSSNNDDLIFNEINKLTREQDKQVRKMWKFFVRHHLEQKPQVSIENLDLDYFSHNFNDYLYSRAKKMSLDTMNVYYISIKKLFEILTKEYQLKNIVYNDVSKMYELEILFEELTKDLVETDISPISSDDLDKLVVNLESKLNKFDIEEVKKSIHSGNKRVYRSYLSTITGYLICKLPIRNSDIVDLDIDQFDFTKNTIAFKIGFGVISSHHIEYKVIIGKDLCQYLSIYNQVRIELSSKSKKMFLAIVGNPLKIDDSIYFDNNILSEAIKEFSKVTITSIRYRCILNLQNKGVNLSDISRCFNVPIDKVLNLVVQDEIDLDRNLVVELDASM